MLGRTRGNGGAKWRRALTLSLGLHGLALLAMGIGSSATVAQRVDGWSTGGSATVPAETPTLVDLAALDIIAPLDFAPIPTEGPVPDPSLAIPADQFHASPSSTPLPVAGGTDHRRPAPDRGTGLGQAVEDPAWRRDASTLHERLSDGAETYQPAHTRTASRATSAQAVRREKRTGPGDSVRTRDAQQAPVAASHGVVEPDQPGLGSETTKGAPAALPSVTPNPAVHDAARAIPTSSEGPLDAQQGTRSFDVDSPGPLATDDRATRAASREDHPGITDLTLAAVSGNSREGRGPSDTPGAIPRPTTGPAPAPTGAGKNADGMGDEQRTQERVYDRYKQEIRARVDRALIWPRALALRLEQGETILRFVVRPDGKLSDGVQVVKSSGFVEFDEAALAAVRQASPFPPMPNPSRARPLNVALRVPFSNPVIR